MPIPLCHRAQRAARGSARHSACSNPAGKPRARLAFRGLEHMPWIAAPGGPAQSKRLALDPGGSRMAARYELHTPDHRRDRSRYRPGRSAPTVPQPWLRHCSAGQRWRKATDRANRAAMPRRRSPRSGRCRAAIDRANRAAMQRRRSPRSGRCRAATDRANRTAMQRRRSPRSGRCRAATRGEVLRAANPTHFACRAYPPGAISALLPSDARPARLQPDRLASTAARRYRFRSAARGRSA